MDALAFRLANALVGNEESAAGLEITLSGAAPSPKKKSMRLMQRVRRCLRGVPCLSLEAAALMCRPWPVTCLPPLPHSKLLTNLAQYAGISYWSSSDMREHEGRTYSQ